MSCPQMQVSENPGHEFSANSCLMSSCIFSNFECYVLVVEQDQPFGMMTAKGAAMMDDGLKKLGKVIPTFGSFLPRIRGVQVKSDPQVLAQPPMS